MPLLAFTVPTVPVPQPRARAVAVGQHARIHPVTHIKDASGRRRPHPIAAFKASVQHAFAAKHDGGPFLGSLTLECVFVLPRPRAKIWKTKPMPRIPHSHKPDLDNLLKAVLDSLNRIAWQDDSQVSILRAEKHIAGGDESPHVRIIIDRVQTEIGASDE